MIEAQNVYVAMNIKLDFVAQVSNPTVYVLG